MMPTRPRPTPRKSTGFEVPNCWLACYDAACDRRIGEPRHVTEQQKKKLNQFFFRIKQSYGLTADELKGAIQFMYAHNPLHSEDLREYGNIGLFQQVIPHFRFWMKQHSSLIATEGMRRAITKSIDRRTETDVWLADLMGQVIEGLK